MAERLTPADHAEVERVVAWAVSEEAPLELIGAASKRGLGRPVQAANTVDLSRLSGVRMYEPDELVLSAGAGTTVKEIAVLLAAQNQALAFEPPDYSTVLGTMAAGTLGGLVASNLAGSRRIKTGAVRDHVLGLRAVSGRGGTFKTGGRVVKNVTGYDLCKLMTGSFGTLAAMTELTFKVLPAPEATRTVLVFGLEDTQAIRAMSAALGSSHDVSGAAHASALAAGRSSVSHVNQTGKTITALRLEGFRPSVVARCEALRKLLADYGETEELHSSNSCAFWQEVNDGHLLPVTGNLWRVSVPPAEGAALAGHLRTALGAEIQFDWGGGLIWVGVSDESSADDAGASIVRGAMKSGHATLFRAAENVRTSVSVFEPLAQPVGALSVRVKQAFDPRGILNPGRMYAGV